MLGVFQKIYDLTESAIHEIDLKLLREKAESNAELGATLFDKYVLHVYINIKISHGIYIKFLHD